MDQATRDRILADYPAFSWLLDIPEVGGLLERAANEGWDITKLQGQLYATNWWKTTSETARTWGTLLQTDPAEAARQREAIERDMRREAYRLGMSLTDAEYLWLSTSAVQGGMSGADITEMLVRTGQRRDFSPGQTRADASAIYALSKQYGVGISGEWALMVAAEIAVGRQTMDGVRDYFHERALWRAASEGNEQIKAGLERGLSLWQVMEPTLSLVAEELEMDVNSFDLTQGLGSQLINYRDNETGTTRMMTDAEAIQFARSQDSWRDTNRAKAEVTQLADAVTKKMGVRA